MVSAALNLQMQPNLPIHRITLFSCTHVLMTQKKKTSLCPYPKDPAWIVPTAQSLHCGIRTYRKWNYR